MVYLESIRIIETVNLQIILPTTNEIKEVYSGGRRRVAERCEQLEVIKRSRIQCSPISIATQLGWIPSFCPMGYVSQFNIRTQIWKIGPESRTNRGEVSFSSICVAVGCPNYSFGISVRNDKRLQYHINILFKADICVWFK